MNVYVRFSGDPVFRAMFNQEQGIRVDLNADGEMVGVAFTGAKAVTIDGHSFGSAAEE